MVMVKLSKDFACNKCKEVIGEEADRNKTYIKKWKYLKEYISR